METPVKNLLLGIGIFFQLIGLFFFFTIVLMYFAIGSFIIGTISIFLSHKKWYLKLCSILPMLFAIGIILNALTFEIFIIPKGFTGVVNIITDKRIGQKREYKFFKRIYKIPPSGILFTKFKQKEGIHIRTFFRIDTNGKMTKLGILDYRNYIEKWDINPPKTEPSRDSFAVFTPELDWNFSKKDYETVFTVGKYKNIKIWNYIPQERIDSIKNIIANKLDVPGK